MATESSFAIPPASFTNTNCVRHIKMDLRNNIGILERRDKTGHRSATIGVKGRGFGSWTYEGSLAPSGTAGTAPDFEPLMVAAMGQAPTLTGGQLVYTFLDTPIPSFSMASYRTPSTLNQRIATGCIVKTIMFNFGQDVAEFTAEGDCHNVVESDNFSFATAEEKCGLSVFPPEPSSPVTNGGIIAGFTGLITIDGNAIVRIRNLQVKMDTQGDVVKDTFGFYYPTDIEAGVRLVTCTFSLYEDDEAAEQALRQVSISKTPVDISAVVGAVSGSIVECDLTQVLLASPTSDDSGLRYVQSWPESRAYGTSITALNELTVKIY
jgi:hypothetical protein